MSVAIIIEDHRCPKHPNDESRMARLDVTFYQASVSPYSLTQSKVKCLDCGEGIPFDLIYDVKVQKTVSVHVSA